MKPDIFERLARWYPVGRVGLPEDIAAAVAYLAADEASFTFSMHGRRNYPFRKVPGRLDVELEDGTTDTES